VVRSCSGFSDALSIDRMISIALLDIRIGRVIGRDRWDSSDVIASPCRRIISRLRSLCHNAAFDAVSMLDPLGVGDCGLLSACMDGVILLILASLLNMDLICGSLLLAMFVCDNLGIHDW